ncbi:MAG: hypothetical protein ACE5Z5_00780 [Candidatus Bathyarchaeia archaeon]
MEGRFPGINELMEIFDKTMGTVARPTNQQYAEVLDTIADLVEKAAAEETRKILAEKIREVAGKLRG